MIIGKKLL